MKRALDILLVLLTAPLWIPVGLAVVIVVLLTEGRPVLHVSDRAGRGGKAFRFLKFRTMRLGEGSDAERLTRVGRFLRATGMRNWGWTSGMLTTERWGLIVAFSF